MPLGDYLAGLAFFAGTWGASAYTAWTVERRRLPRLDRAPRIVALALLFLAALLAAHLLPGVLAILSPGAVTATALAGAGLASRLPPSGVRDHAASTPPPKDDDDSRVSWVLARVGVLAVSAFALAALSTVRHLPPTHVDAASFAMPGVADWVRSGSIWKVGAYLPLLQVRTYPNNGDVLALATVLPWSNDAFLRILPVPLLGMTGLGVYGIGRELRARASTAVLLAAAAVSARALAVPAVYDLKPDAFMYATFAGGMLFLLRHARTGARSDLVLAGLGLGLSFGSRWYGISSVAVVLAIWIAALYVARRPRQGILRDAALLTGVVLAAGGIWLLRNLLLTGNPLYPIKIAPLGVTLFDAPRDVITEKFGFTVADRLGEAGFLRHHLAPGFRFAFGLPGALALGGTLLAAAFAVKTGRKAADARLPALVLAVGVLTVVYAFLPAGAQGLAASPVPGIVGQNARWLVPAFLLGVGATAWVGARLPPRGALAVEVVALVCAVVAARAAFPVGAARVAAVALLLVLAWAFAPLLARLPAELARQRKREVLVASAVAFAVVLAVAGYAHQRDYNDARFARSSAAVDWVDAHAPSHSRVGVTGSWSANFFVPTYALFGPRFGNQVEYVGPIVSDQVRFYRDSTRFRRALRRGRYDLLAVGRLEEPDIAHPRIQRTLAVPPEERWARSAGFAEVARDERFVLLARSKRGGG
jgi:hypothetical protein